MMKIESAWHKIRACVLGLLLLINSLFLPSLLCVFTLVSRCVFKKQMRLWRDWIYRFWVGINRSLIHAFLPTRFVVRAAADLDREKWYLAVSNHRSWLDILLIQMACLDHVSFQLKFFLKEVLIYLPMIGPACWALHFPFVRRFTPKQIRNDINKCKQHNRRVIENACAHYRDEPTILLNFLEGTRFTEIKREAKRSPYRHLLPPHAAGVAYAASALRDQWTSFLDITLIYPPNQSISFWDFLQGKLDQVVLHMHTVPLPKETGDYDRDVDYKKAFQSYMKKMWFEKDQFIEDNH